MHILIHYVMLDVYLLHSFVLSYNYELLLIIFFTLLYISTFQIEKNH